MKARKLKVLALLLAAAMAVTACGQAGTPSSKESESKSESSAQSESSKQTESSTSVVEEEEVVALSIFSANNVAADANAVGWFQEYLAEELHVSLEFRSTSQKAKATIDAYMAAKDMPDIIAIKNNTQINTAVQAGLLLNLDDYKDQLPSIYENEVYDLALGYSRESLSNGTGGLYVVPTMIGTDNRIGADPMVRWDLYKKLGYPEVNNFDELAQMLKQMMALEPTTKDGLKTYGISLFTDWDSGYMYAAWGNYGRFMGYEKETINKLVEVKSDGSAAPKSRLDDDSNYKQALQWLFECNQMGIIDPDSVTQKYDNYSAKNSNGQVLYPFAAVSSFVNEDKDSDNFVGYASMWPDFFVQTMNGNYAAGNSAAVKLAISADCENVDRALRFINWFYSYDGANLWWNGPEGVLWETVDGKKVPTDLYYTEGFNYEFPAGGNVVGQQMLINAVSLAPAAINPDTDQIMNIFMSDVVKSSDDSKLMKDWQSVNGDYSSMYNKLITEEPDRIIEKSAAFAYLPTQSDEVTEITTAIGEILVTNSWKMVFAKDQAEFDALWEQTKKDAQTLGIDKVVKESQERWETAKETYASFAK